MENKYVRFNFNEMKEALIVGTVMTGILLPVRLVFYNFVSDNWFGSLGLISLITALMIFAVKKGWLGKFGEIFERQMYKIHHGKRRIIAYSMIAFWSVGFFVICMAIEQGNTTYVYQKELILAELGMTEQATPEDFRDAMSELENPSVGDVAQSSADLMYLLFFDFGTFAAFIATIDHLVGGWYLHFATVFLVENLEVIGVLIFYKLTMKEIPKP